MTAAGAQGLEGAGVGSLAEAGPTGLVGEDLARVDPSPGHRAHGPQFRVHASSVRNRPDRDQRDRDQREHDQPGRGPDSRHLVLGPRVLARLVLRRIAAVTTFPMAPVSRGRPIARRRTADHGARGQTADRGAQPATDRPATARLSAGVEAAVQASHARVHRGPAPAPFDRVAISPGATGSIDDRSARVTSPPGARDRSATGPGLRPHCRRRTCLAPMRNSSQVGDRSRKRSPRDGPRSGCLSSRSAANRSRNWCSTPRACGSRSSSSKAGR